MMESRLSGRRRIGVAAVQLVFLALFAVGPAILLILIGARAGVALFVRSHAP
jgi:hypothetical protein